MCVVVGNLILLLMIFDLFFYCVVILVGRYGDKYCLCLKFVLFCVILNDLFVLDK